MKWGEWGERWWNGVIGVNGVKGCERWWNGVNGVIVVKRVKGVTIVVKGVEMG